MLSGYIVNTIATWDAVRDGFLISTPTLEAEKNWISQGLYADWVVVFAKLIVHGKDHGPHPFLVRMRDRAGDHIQLTAGVPSGLACGFLYPHCLS